MITEKEMIELLKNGNVTLPPLTFKLVEPVTLKEIDEGAEAIIEGEWGRKKAKFIAEIKPKSTPKIFNNAINRLRVLKPLSNFFPLIILPYLSEGQLIELDRLGINGLDLCGNGVIAVPGVFSVFRSGAKNRFPATALIKNIYSKKSSLVGRIFLVKATFDSVQDILIEINQRNIFAEFWYKKALSLSTVSKVLKNLTDDLIIERNGNIRLLQADKLIEKLSTNYKSPAIKEQIQLKLPGKSETILKSILEESWALDMPCVVTGLSSVKKYAVMQRGEMISIYCPDAKMLLDNLSRNKSPRFVNMKIDDRFPNLQILGTEDEIVYFDYRYDGSIWWSSPVQVYLELMAGNKRDQETAEQVKSYIFNSIRSK